MPLISVTRLRVRGLLYLPGFVLRTFQSAFQAKAAAGNLRMRLLRDARLAFWTVTVWESEAAMRDFMLAGAHRKAMHNLLEWCDEAALAHWQDDNAAPPDWLTAHKLLLERGRTSKVRHPTADHLAFSVPLPVVEVGRVLNFK